MYEKFKSPHHGVGTIVDVSIDYTNKLIKRHFQPGSVTVGQNVHNYNYNQVKQFFNNELKWLEILESKWVPETVETGSNFIVQKYYGPCLLDSKPNNEFLNYVPDIMEQIIEMYEFFKSHNVFKRNGSLSNLTHNNGQLIAFDFKWATTRPNGIEMELKSYKEWLSKIDSKLEQQLTNLI